ncbi:MAG: Ig-like domain-containing protein [Acidimicrobiales bacterium]
MRRVLVGLAVLCGTLALGGVAWGAAWVIRSATGSSASTKAHEVPPGSAPSVLMAGSAVTVSIPQVSVGGARLGTLPGGGYVVKRYSTAGAAQAVGDSCATPVSGAAATLTCVEGGVGDGAWMYRVTPVLGTWRGAEGPAGGPVTVDVTGPSLVSITLAGSSPTAGSSVSWTVTFSEPVTGVDAGDFSLAPAGVGGAAVTSVAGSGTTRTITAATGSGSGTLGITLVDDDSIRDGAGNPLAGAGGGGGGGGPAYALDRSAPTLASLVMLDTNGNGKVDQVNATFGEALAPYTAGTTGWSLANIPSAGSLTSVSVSGATATLTLSEGAGAADTSPGSFTVALTAHPAGIRDGLGNQSSFTATAPTDQAAPRVAAVSLVDGGGTPGRVQPGDQIVVTFSEAMKVSKFCSAWSTDTGNQSLTASNDVTVTLADGGSGNDSLTVASGTCAFNFGTLDLGSGSYVSGSNATFKGSGSSKSTIAWNAAARTLTIVLGSKSGGTTATVSSSTPVYTAPGTLTDPAGNPVSPPTFTLPAGAKF